MLNSGNGRGRDYGNDRDRDGDNRQQRKIERWETLDVLYDGREKRQGGVEIGVAVEVKQPVFEGGSKGFPKMNTTVSRGDRFLRFMCFNGDISEIRDLAWLLNDAVRRWDGLVADYESHVDDYHASRKNGDQGRDDVEPQDAEPVRRKRQRGNRVERRPERW